MTYVPEHLTPYKRPRDYMGPDWYDYYSFLGQSRDSSTLERSNFSEGLKALGGESETVLVIRDSHWAVGWIETIWIHNSDENALKIADSMKKQLEDYPVLNEEAWSSLEYEEAASYWESMSLSCRVSLLQECGVSVFAARRDEIPSYPVDPNGRVYESLTTN